MTLSILDISIVVAYLILIVLLGLYISKRASKNINSYFLGGNKIPWWILGISNASGMFDITGTIWLVMLLFIYGLKSLFIPWAWPIFNQIFLMVFLSAWLRRSNVMTGAEWLKTRFGEGKGAILSQIIIVIFAIVSVIGFLAYAFKGSGLFFKTFLPWNFSANTYALIIMFFAAIYVIKGGMYSVVLTEIIQFTIMTIASIAIGIIAINKVSPETLNAVLPAGWDQLFFHWKLNLDWSHILPDLNAKIASEDYSIFGFFFMMVLFKGFLVSLAGPAPNYDMQRILSTKNPVEASKMSGMVNIALFFPRYMMIAGLTVLALGFYIPQIKAMGGNFNFESLLPIAIRDFVPNGLRGLLVAGLVAAFMSTYAATVNAAPAYLVNDIYKRFIKPNADEKIYVRMSYIVSLAVVIVGCLFGYMTKSVDQVTLWIVNSLWGGYTTANFLKWYWWRFNGYGYFWGMVAGLASLFIVPLLFPNLNSLQGFPLILLLSLIGSLAGTLLTPPENYSTLKNFYMNVRPWGFWKPVYEKVIKEHPEFEKNKNFGKDMFNVIVGIIWQLSLMAVPVYMVIHRTIYMIIGIVIILITTIILKFTWWNKLEQNFGEKKKQIEVEEKVVYSK
jgi:SSS family solute:Na+ symporter